jgi:hypothetical protein
MHMIMFVLDDPDLLDDILDAWYEVGISGVTIIESTGIHRRRGRMIPTRYVFPSSSNIEEGHYTLFAIVDDERCIGNCLAATEKVVGDLSRPSTGVFTAWPLTLTKGIPKEQPS